MNCHLLRTLALCLVLVAALAACGGAGKPEAAPYGIDMRPMPSGMDAESLLPAQVGSFSRGPIDGDIMSADEVYATYTSGSEQIMLTVGVGDDASVAQEGVRTAKEVLESDNGGAFGRPEMMMGAEPSYFKVSEGDIMFMAWQRGPYFFSVDSQGSSEALDSFMKAFPY